MPFKLRINSEGSNDKEQYETSMAAYRKHPHEEKHIHV